MKLAKIDELKDELPEEIFVNLNARVPKELWRRVRLHCLKKGIILRKFTTDALVELLAKEQKPKRTHRAVKVPIATSNKE